jgi:WXG100 family type VII secretion target
MATIKLTPDELRTSAQKYTTGSEQIDEILSNLTAEQGVIADNWEGTAFDSFEEQFNELSPKIRDFAELLQSINQQLNKVAEIIEQTDADIASQIRS